MPFAAVNKSYAFSDRNTIPPIESQVSNTFIANVFTRSGDERPNLYKSFHFETIFFSLKPIPFSGKELDLLLLFLFSQKLTRRVNNNATAKSQNI